MKKTLHSMLFTMAAGFFVFCGSAATAQDPAESALEPVRAAMEQQDYRRAAREASQLARRSGNSVVAEQARQLSISANLALRNAGHKVSDRCHAFLDKHAGRLLILTDEDTYYRSFELKCGADFTVPSGEFQVGAKLGYPNLELNGVLYKRGAAGNTLGSRWIELRPPEGSPVTGLHGEAPLAPDEEQLFFRLKNSDINEIFLLLSEGSRVSIK